MVDHAVDVKISTRLYQQTSYSFFRARECRSAFALIDGQHEEMNGSTAPHRSLMLSWHIHISTRRDKVSSATVLLGSQL